MVLRSTGIAGTLESGDALVTVQPGTDALEIELSGPSALRYREQIQKAVLDSLTCLRISSARVQIQEKGALDCTIRARLVAACSRAAGSGEPAALDTQVPLTPGSAVTTQKIDWEALR